LSLVLLIRQPITPPLHHWNQAPMSLDLGAEPGWLHPATNHALTVRVLMVSTVRALSSCDTGQSGTAPDRQCSLFDAPSATILTLRELFAHCALSDDRCAG
jgi:hypothetical protein